MENKYNKAKRYQKIGLTLIILSIVFVMVMIMFGLKASTINTNLDPIDGFLTVINQLIRKWALTIFPALTGIYGGSLLFNYGLKLQRRALIKITRI